MFLAVDVFLGGVSGVFLAKLHPLPCSLFFSFLLLCWTPSFCLRLVSVRSGGLFVFMLISILVPCLFFWGVVRGGF